MSVLTAKRVEEIFVDCLFQEGEDTSKHVVAEGITCTVGFHPERLASHKTDIEEMLAELSDDFKTGGGGGMSFLNACQDRHGTQWGEHRQIEQLFQLGIAIGRARYCMPREMWSVFPGGMPYVTVLSEP